MISTHTYTARIAGTAPILSRTNLAVNTARGVVNGMINAVRGTLTAGTDYVRLTVTDATALDLAQRIDTSATGMALQPVTPGQVITLSASGRTSAAGKLMRVQLQFRNASNTIIGTAQSGTPTTVNAATFTMLAPVTATAPAGAARLYWGIGLAGTGARIIGDTVDAQNVLMEVAPTAGSFFDGSTPDTADQDYAWTGTPNASTSTLSIVPGRLDVLGGSIDSDDSRAPRIIGTLDIPIPDAATDAILDPRENVRVTVTCSGTYSAGPASMTRTFDLGLRDRRDDLSTGRTTITLTSDEALLVDDVLLGSTPNTAATLYNNLRSIIDNVILSRIGAHLEPGPTAPITSIVDATNTVPNPSFELDLTGWAESGATMTRVAGGGGQVLQVVSTAADSFVRGPILGAGFQAGRKYTVAAAPRVVVPIGGTLNPHARTMVVFVHTPGMPAGTYLETASAQYPNAADQIVPRLSFDVTIPSDADDVFLRLYNGGTVGTVTWDRVSVVENAGVPGVNYATYFDGDTADSTSAAYAWTGAPHNSPSTRTALDTTDPAALIWQPGETAWAFIQPLFRAAAMRLFCDGSRKWFLVDATYAAAGSTELAFGVDVISAENVLSRDTDEWFDAAQVRYRWKADDGSIVEAFDSYAPAGYVRPTVLEVERPYPGPGAARYMVERAAGKGRRIQTTAVARYDTMPAQPLQITLPNTLHVGEVLAVVFDLTRDEMTVTSRGLTDVPDYSWQAGPVGTAWNELPAGMSWPELDWKLTNG